MGFDALVRWLAPDAAPGAYNDWRLVSDAAWGDVALYAGSLLFAMALALSIVGLRRVPWRRRLPLIFLRVAGAALVAFILLEPAIELRAVSRVRSRVAVLIDDSRSMSLATPGGTRAERVLAHLQDNLQDFEDLSRRAVLEWHLFDGRTRPVEGAPAELSTEGRSTDLGRVLGEVSWQGSGRELGAVVLYSDGTDTEGLTEAMARREGARVGAPIYAVGFGDDAATPDLAIRRVPSDDFAFVHNTVTLDVDLESRGLSVDSVDVTLEHEGRILQTKLARFEGGRATASFEFKPRDIGKQVYRVSVPIQAGESVESNNEKSVVLKVIRDRIRVLQVAGRPSWDQRFLRELLKRNPSVDLISFFILRSTTDLQKASQDELALIPFPVHELFTEELDTFDVVIYQNFSYRPYRMDRYLPNIRDYVNGGGGFLMIGGDQSFEDGWYSGTALAEILPVRLGGAPAWDEAEFRPRLTEQGRVHPITRIGEAGEPPDAVFRRLPALSGVNPSLGLMPGAAALLTHPSLPGNPPVVATREVQDGRALAVTTDSLWFWRFLAVGSGSAGREFDRFWSTSLRWLIRDPDLDRVRVRVERSVAMRGDPVGAEIEVLGPDYRPLEGVEVFVELARPNVGGDAVELPEGRSVRTGPAGTALVRWEGVPPGTYVVRAEAVDGVETVGTAREPLIVEAADVELQAPFPRPNVMRALAESSGGRYVDIGDDLPPIELEDALKVEIDRSRRVPIWDRWPLFALLLLIVGAEWWSRRRAGLL